MQQAISHLMPHLMLAPIALPMLAAALMLLLGEERQRVKLALSCVCTLLGLGTAVALLLWTDQAADGMQRLGVYMPGNWPMPFGIALALDRLSAMMLVLVHLVALAALVFSSVRWHRAGVHFHPLFQLQLMGLSGAFLTADVFNLFVFFEIMLAASYGLLLHGSGRTRVQAGLHYIAINLAASSLFLIGASMLYGLTGTLHMAELARAIALVAEGDRALLHAAAAILGTAFLIKAAMWPLNFWLVPAYSAATAPVGAVFALMTKVGVYVVLRLFSLLFHADAGASAGFGSAWLLGGGMLSMTFGALGMLGAQRATHMAGFGAILSSGTLLAAASFSHPALTAGLLYYLPSSTLGISALFLLADVVDRWRSAQSSGEPYEDDEAPFLNAELLPTEGFNLDEEEELLIGRAIPAAAAFVGNGFLLATLVVAGLPPLSGFIGKLAMLTALLNPLGLGAASYSDNAAQADWRAWLLAALLIATGLLALLALVRAGIRHFWSGNEGGNPTLRSAEGLPIALLLGACLLMSVQARALTDYTQRTADALLQPEGYVRALLERQPVPDPGHP